ncbi:MAG TPA: hypothetical protein VHV78_05835 [Gemmatimonadaceae bacterium]|nr:hypothetical protein [Gemmatimonadaceae bacterium]
MALVHRALSGAASNDTASAIGFAAAVRALKHGAAGELLVTRRFAERQPLAAANTLLLAAIFGVRTTTLTGPAELQLDLMAGGVATLARCSNG